MQGVVTSGYGQRVSDFTGENSQHNGVDIAADIGTAVVAAGDGVVSSVEVVSGYGVTVVLDHGGGLKSIYAHLSSTQVRVGDVVRVGEVIALSGDTGRVTGAHLHFEINVCKRGRDKLERCWPRNPNRFVPVKCNSNVKVLIKSPLTS